MHLDGYNFLPYFEGKEEKVDSMLYFSANAELNAVRWNDFKISFAVMDGNITTPGVSNLTGLKLYTYVLTHSKSPTWIWHVPTLDGDNMWLFATVVWQVQEFMNTLTWLPNAEQPSTEPW